MNSKIFTGHYGRLCYGHLCYLRIATTFMVLLHVIETAAHAPISLAAVVEKGSLEH